MKTIPLNQVVVGERTRVTDEAHVLELAQSIRERGLIQPIVLRRQDNRIIAGGHRFAAFTILATNTDELGEGASQYEEIPFLYFDEYLIQTGRLKEGDEISDSQLMVLEMEENLKRLDMTWQEKSVGIYRYHRQQVKESRQLDVEWMQSTTGKMLNLSQASVSQNLKVGEELATNPKSPLHQCESLADALRFKIAQKIDAAARLKSMRIKERTIASREAAPVPASERSNESPLGSTEGVSHPTTTEEHHEPDPARPYSLELLRSLYYVGDFRNQLPLIAKDVNIDHIICDPPYAIDMKNLDTIESISRVEKTHQVDENLDLIKDFLQVAFDVISESGFLCMWYDLDHHTYIRACAEKVGWKVCRWPLVWCKSSPCRNSVPQYNFTKSTEVCYIMRRSEKAVLVNKQSNNYIIAPNSASKTHPFVKPFQVWERLISAVSMKNQTIVDPFAGEGSCISSAIQLERYAYGCEIDEQHVFQGVDRMDTELNRASRVLAEFEDEVPF